LNIKGGPRGAPAALARHVQKDENEKVWIVGTHDLLAQDIDGAIHEMDALGAALKTSKTLYHMQLNPAPNDPEMSPAQVDYAVDLALRKLGLDNQPHLVIGHEKYGKEDGVLRRHYHIIAARTDLEHMRAIPCSHNFRKHEEASREIERELGHERVQGVHVERFGIARPERTPTHAQMQRANRGGVSAKEAKALGAELWAATDSGKAISAALESHGWQLARGDKERANGGAYFMAVDPAGEAHELRRMMPVKAKELYDRMADLDAADLPSVKEAKERQDERALMREAHEAAKGRVDDIRPETASRDFSGAASTITEPAREATQTQKHGGAADAPEPANTRTTEPEREPAPARDAPRVIYLPAELGRAADIIGGLADGFEKALGATLDFAADFIAPPPPPTKEQVEQMQKAAEERRQQEPAMREQAEQEARFKEILEQIRRDDQRARYDRYTGQRLDGDHDHDRDYSRGRERER
jgi:MobA/VirD2-like, nuclease domain